MMCRRFTLAFTLVFALASLRAAAAPALPPDSVDSDTAMVIQATADGVNPAGLKAAAKAVLGDNVMTVKGPLDIYEKYYNLVTAAGVDSVTLMTGAGSFGLQPVSKPPSFVVYFGLKPGIDAKNVEKVITELLPPEASKELAFFVKGQYLAVSPKSYPLPGKPDAQRASLLAEALQSREGSSIRFACILPQEMRDEFVKAPKQPDLSNEAVMKALKDIQAILAGVKWIALSASFGNAPELHVIINVGDADSAKRMVDCYALMSAEFKKQPPNADAMGPIGHIAIRVIAMHPKSSGSQVEFDLNSQDLSALVDFLMTVPGKKEN